MKTILKKSFSNNSRENVTLIGLGNMGYKMAVNLTKKYTVSGFDLNKEAVDNFHKLPNTQKHETIENAVKKSTFVITMLDKTTTVEKVWKDILNFKLEKNPFVVDSSTINPIASKQLCSLYESKGIRSADAPVSGGVVGAEKATLTFMVGCKESEFKDLEPYLSTMGARVFHCGEYGTGQIAKLCNNMALGAINAVVGESLSLGYKLGMNMDKLVNIMKVSSSNNNCLHDFNPVPGINPNAASSRDYERGFRIELMDKDMTLALELADQVKSDLKVSKMASQYYKTVIKNGKKDKDFTYTYDCTIKNKL